MAKHDNRVLVWTLIASQFAPPFMFSGVAVALPDLGADLHAGATALGLVETLFLAGTVAFLLPLGQFADFAEKRALYKLGLLVFGVASLIAGMLSSLPAILCIRFLQGVASALFAVTGPAILTDIVAPEQRGRAYGSSIGAIYTGLTLGPIVAGILVSHISWRAVFVCGGLMVLLALALTQWRMPSTWRRASGSVHVPSTVLIVSAVLCLVAGSAALQRPALAYSCLLIGVALGAAFVRLQRRVPKPLLDVNLLAQSPELGRALLTQFLLYVNAFSSVFMLSIYIQVSLGHSAARAGQVLATGSVLMALAAPVAGRLADRYPARLIAAFGVALVLLSAILATLLDQHSSLLHVTLVLAIQGLGYAMFSSPNMTIIMGSLPPSALSTASALSAKARSLGMVFGMLATGLLISLRFGNDPIGQHPERLIPTQRAVFSVLVALGGVALAIGLSPSARHAKT